MSISFGNSNLAAKSLKQLTDESVEILSKLEITEKGLELRDALADVSIISSDVILKRGFEIDDRFLIVAVATDRMNLIVDAYEEKTEKRFGLKIKR